MRPFGGMPCRSGISLGGGEDTESEESEVGVSLEEGWEQMGQLSCIAPMYTQEISSLMHCPLGNWSMRDGQHTFSE